MSRPKDVIAAVTMGASMTGTGALMAEVARLKAEFRECSEALGRAKDERQAKIAEAYAVGERCAKLEAALENLLASIGDETLPYNHPRAGFATAEEISIEAAREALKSL